ncbi:cytochrome P450, partial [Penicillium robsamsonii]|uniref:cytochrome P450 n=1 Tax=Penicillium robsamsonii TaxID=1792511 RepID=UPI002548660F
LGHRHPIRKIVYITSIGSINMSVTIAAIGAISMALLVHYICRSLLFSPLARIPGPKSFALTKWRLASEDYQGTRTRKLHALHEEYGPVVRVGPNEVTFNSLSALRSIYGAGSGFERTKFYHMFSAYGRQNMFSFSAVKQHGERKKIFANAYAKSTILKGETAHMIETKVKKFIELLERERDNLSTDIFPMLHYFSLDNITEFVYGDFGETACLDGVEEDRALLRDIMATGSRKLSWLTVHHPKFTVWLYSKTGIMGCIARQFYPMQGPIPYTGIKLYAMNVFRLFSNASAEERTKHSSLISKLWKHHLSQKEGGLDDFDIASECADHLDGGIDTTSDTLMFAIWSLSRPEHRKFQKRLIDEVQSLSENDLNADGVPRAEVTDKLEYVSAVIKETLRLFAPLPASEPRSLPKDTTIDGYPIPAHTVVSISPYVLHRNADVFRDPRAFNPDRWLDSSQDVAQMKKFFWAFSSGARMCIGMHLAMAEMTTLLAALYRKYTTQIINDFDVISPGITSRFEVFYDEDCSGVREHECQIAFTPQ